MIGAIVLTVAFAAAPARARHAAEPPVPQIDCFLLYEIGVGEVRRSPDRGCATRVAPQSTFKIPHALAALDAGVLSGADASFAYDGSAQPFESWRHDHTLASAMRYSVVWYFQRVAKALGERREAEYAQKLEYGNADTTSGPTSFWLGGSLTISPEEQQRFLLRLFDDRLPVTRRAMQVVRDVLIQPDGKVMNATGAIPFGRGWKTGTVLRAKTGSGHDQSGVEVRWIVGHISRGSRAWVFVSCLTGRDLPSLAAVDLAERGLSEAGALKE